MRRVFPLVFTLMVFCLASCSTMVDDIKKLQANTKYTVKENFESLETPDKYDEESTITTEVEAKPGDKTDVKAKTYEGFEAQTFEQQTIASDGSTEINIYYKRKTVTFTFAPQGGTWKEGNSDPLVLEFRFGQAFNRIEHGLTDDCAVNANSDYILKGWNPPLPETVPAQDMSFTPLWSQEIANYSVEYYFEKTEWTSESTRYELKDEFTVTRKAQVGQLTQADTLSPDKTVGFEIANSEEGLKQEEVLADGSTTIKIYYNRKNFTYTFYSNGGSWGDGSTIQSIDCKYGQSVSAPDTSTLSLEDYDFTGKWLDAANGNVIEIPSAVTESKKFYAQWSQEYASYKIEYYIEPLDSDTPALDSSKTVTLKAKIGDSVSTTAEPMEGFEANVVPATVSADSSAVVSVSYTRKTVTLSFNPVSADGGKWSDSSTTPKTLSGKFGHTVDLSSIPEPTINEDWDFVEWTGLPKTYPSEDAEYKAAFTKEAVYYSVIYRQQNTAGTSYVEVYSENKKGAVGKQTTASPDAFNTESHGSLAGFSALEVEQKSLTAASTPDNTKVYVDFKRNTVTVKFLPGTDGSWASGKEAETVSGLYGSTLTAPSSSTLSRKDYRFNGWAPAVPAQFPAEETSFTAQWQIEYVPYIIEFSYQQPDGTYKVQGSQTGSTKLKIGTTTSLTKADVPAPATAYLDPSIVNTSITENGANTVSVKYPRKTVKYTFNLNGGNIGGSSSNVIKSGLYESSYSGCADIVPVRANYVFAGWDKTGSSTFLADETFTAIWNSAVSYGLSNTVGNDISVSTPVLNGKQVTTAVTVPYAGNWTYTWYLDKTLVSDQNGASFSKTLTKGKHTILVVASEGSNSFSRQMTVFVD